MLLKSKDPLRQVRGAKGLAGMTDQRSIDCLTFALSDEDGRVRDAAKAALRTTLKLIRGDELSRTLERLADSVHQEAVDVLMVILSADFRTFYEPAFCRALARIGNLAAVQELASLSELSPNERTSSAATRALHELGDTKVLEPLRAALKGENAQDALFCLTHIRDRRIVPDLVTMLAGSDSSLWSTVVPGAEGGRQPWRPRSGHSNLRHSNVVSALNKIDPQWVNLEAAGLTVSNLSTFVKDNNAPKDERKEVASVLARIGGPLAGYTLIELLREEDRDIREAAASALESIATPETKEAVCNYRQNEREEQRRLAEQIQREEQAELEDLTKMSQPKIMDMIRRELAWRRTNMDRFYQQQNEFNRSDRRLKRIGEELDGRGGIELMRKVFQGLPGNRSLDMIWGGIGEWLG